MNNALFITGLALFFQIWGASKLGTLIAKLTANQFDGQMLLSMLGGALLAFVPFMVTGPAWRILDQPLILAGQMLIVLLAIGIPMFVPAKYREAAFGPKTYPTWLGLTLVLSAIYLFAQPRDLAVCVSLSALFAGLGFLWQGAKQLRKP